MKALKALKAKAEIKILHIQRFFNSLIYHDFEKEKSEMEKDLS